MPCVFGRRHNSKRRVFESQHCILIEHFFTYACKSFNVFEKTKINEKEAGDGPLKNKQ